MYGAIVIEIVLFDYYPVVIGCVLNYRDLHT